VKSFLQAGGFTGESEAFIVYKIMPCWRSSRVEGVAPRGSKSLTVVLLHSKHLATVQASTLLQKKKRRKKRENEQREEEGDGNKIGKQPPATALTKNSSHQRKTGKSKSSQSYKLTSTSSVVI